DLLAMHLPMKRFLVRSWHETGELPLWFPYSFAGAPFVHDVQVAMFYPPHWPLLLLSEERVGAALTWLVVLHVVVAGWCGFALARPSKPVRTVPCSPGRCGAAGRPWSRWHSALCSCCRPGSRSRKRRAAAA